MLFNGLLLSLFLEYVNPDSFIPVIGAIKIGTIIPLLTFFYAILKREPTSNKDVLSQPVTKWILFFLFLLTISVLTAEVTLYSFDVFIVVLANVFWYLMIVKLVTDFDKLKRVFAVLIWSHILLLILNPEVVLEPESRSYLRGAPFLGDGNDFSLSVCVIWPLCLILIRDAKSRTAKLAYTAAIVVLILAIVGTQSRGAFLALTGAFGFLWWFSERKVVGLIAIAIVVIGVVSFAPPVYFQRMQTITEYEQDGSAMGRITAWKSSLQMAKSRPLTGVGSGHFAVAFGTEFRPPELRDQSVPWLTAHSMYFLVIGELGIPGIVCLLAILIGNFVRLGRLRKRARGHPDSAIADYAKVFLMLNTGLVGLCIGGLFLSVAYYPHIFVLSGLIVASSLSFERKLLEINSNSDDLPVSKLDGKSNKLGARALK